MKKALLGTPVDEQSTTKIDFAEFAADSLRMRGLSEALPTLSGDALGHSGVTAGLF